MIAHVVLFRPKAALTAAERAGFVNALEHALAGIPQIAHARIGRRVMLGQQYDQHNVEDYPFVAILEFASEADLRGYLDHPAHQALGQQFYITAAAAFAGDFELLDQTQIHELL